ncbi:hypothetical protein PRIPAC_96654 [Pristionchus pacificus]|uniref:Uncharacterized protein n=1 Tax=Pristionchus pacificus TaxID=54126 RepID=A0A2A6B2T7_PRIPA|nr:hypothetical protein PRIPAC_96654 [Pristionchus pacificus]|eukprot:PDM60197.1 hypothetical protein PRIPAC_54022 [Pristionchus pacificus]
MFILPLLLLAQFAGAFVRLQNSILYDEVDFRGVNEVSTDMCASGCKMYAAIGYTDEQKRIANGILILDPITKKNTSVTELSKQFVQGSQEKSSLEFDNTPTLTIVNTNVDYASAPLALFIVSAKSPYYRTAEVFEPLSFRRDKAIASAPITILSAVPFSVLVQPGDTNAVLARTTGYDAIDRNGADNCYTAFDKNIGTAGFFLAINGPLLTLSFDMAKYPFSQVDMIGSYGLAKDTYPFPKQDAFISSPGFVCGSPSSHQVFRSSLLTDDKTYTLRTIANQEMVVKFDIDMETDLPVKILDEKTGIEHGFTGSFQDGTNTHSFQLQTTAATVSFTPGSDQSLFGMRVHAEAVAKP